LDVDAHQNVNPVVAQSQGLRGFLQMIVGGVAGQPDIALARIWLIGPGDVCSSCRMRSLCFDQTRCLHLAASAGNPLIEAGSAGGPREDWDRIGGQFQRIPLNTPGNLGHITVTSTPVHIRIADGGEQLWISHPDWMRQQEIRDFAAQPLISNGEVLGMLAVFSRTEMSEREFGLLRTLAGEAAAAIRTTQVTEQARTLNTSITAISERWRAVFEKSAIGVAMIDSSGRFLIVNRAYEKLVGYTEEELRKLSFCDITPEDFRESSRAPVEELWAGKRDQYELEKPYRHKDGSLKWVRLHASIFHGTESVPPFVMALCEDITERKRAEESLRRSEERWRTLLEINNAIIATLNEKEFLHAICEAVKRVVPIGGVALILRDPATDGLRITAFEGLFPGGNFSVGTEIREECISRWVVDNCRPIVRNDVEAERQYPTELLLLGEGIRSLCALPLIVRGKPVGVLFIGSPTKGQYSESDVPFLQEVANQVALAIGNMQAYQEIGRLNSRVARTADHLRTLLEINNAIITNLSQEALLGSIAEALRRFIPFERAALTLYLPDRKAFRFVAIAGGFVSDYFQPGLEIGLPDSSVGWVFEHQEPIVRRDLEREQQYANERRLAGEGMRSHCVVPLIVRGKSIGTLNVASSAANQYSESTAEFLQEAANQVALALENMRSYEEITTLKGRLEKENIYLQEEICREHNFEEIVGNSPALKEVLHAVAQVAPTDTTVLIQGETGTGKELIARAIHNLSPRKGKAFVKVNCAAIPLGLLESELFGHEKGAFTGAISQKVGRFELAHKGTLFLDEIGDIPLELQPKLLRVLQEQEFERLGSTRVQQVDVRVVAATNADLAGMVAERKFRADLYYRLNIFPIDIPPLRARRDDIPFLIRHFVAKYARRMGKTIASVPNETMDALCRYAWPGNIRELQNLMERAVLLSSGPSLRVPLTDILLSLDLNAAPGTNILDQTEREQILRALRKSNWVVGGPNGAAAALGLKRTSLVYKMQRLGISRSSE
jgi:formate hydrogenlyase transcriptional activator